ncbi:DMT family transporter [Pedobacter antarcticus]|uniref:Permease n=2 Tax=Pedobacter antarcticus TaxID=34086 RepID=A0A081PEF8_9SPHI|nr:EamA family transporter [Pedobacter antarcticus]KEQ29081.1 permease [Pedobacter antarcticus 4BY]SDL66959.1 Permease of the drug/metabolite transporter (DMT) superfamily [Pedobacter antarcticus]SFE90954.1 Permease of the drug/metabolite transporter (DMT) superfamily [Pedobacter antarcticus]
MTKPALNEENRSLLILHGTILIWGFTGILGALISIDPVRMVWYRVMIASITLFFYFKASKFNLKISRKEFLQFFFTGSIVALHWILFFEAIKVSTVSVALVCLSAFTLFTAILEPFFRKTKIQLSDIIIGLVIIAGIYMIFKFESNYTMGIIVGLSAALCSATFSVFNSMFAQKSDAKIIGFYEISGAFVWITLYRIFDGTLSHETFNLSTSDWIYLFILGTVCTALAYIAGVSVMRTLSAFRVALITNLEPVYGIILAYLFFDHKETMSLGFYGGTVLILGAVFLYPIYKKRQSQLGPSK